MQTIIHTFPHIFAQQYILLWGTNLPSMMLDLRGLWSKRGWGLKGTVGRMSFPLLAKLATWSQLEFLFPPVLWNSCRQTPLTLKARFSVGLLFPLPDPQGEESNLGLRTFTPVGALLWYNYFLVCGLPICRIWDSILLCLCSSCRLVVAAALSLGVGYPFW